MDSNNLGVFCSVGDAKRCIQDLEGCKCQEDCSVSSEFNISSQYHCNEGSADQQNVNTFLIFLNQINTANYLD